MIWGEVIERKLKPMRTVVILMKERPLLLANEVQVQRHTKHASERILFQNKIKLIYREHVFSLCSIYNIERKPIKAIDIIVLPTHCSSQHTLFNSNSCCEINFPQIPQAMTSTKTLFTAEVLKEVTRQ